jgi:hypothetical protein
MNPINTEIIETNMFVKAIKTLDQTPKLAKQNVLASIPSDCVNERDIELSKIKTEWRWQFYKIPQLGKFITISYKNHGEERKYINQRGDYINFQELIEFEQYITKTYYHYC